MVGAVNAQTIDLDFQGNAGFGLLPGNAVPGAPGSTASGGETGAGLVLDRDAGTLDFAFDFQGLSGGLADVASGIHLHIITDPNPDIFNATGGIAFNLNSGTDPNVLLDAATVAFGTTAATVSGTVINLDDTQEQAFLDGLYYLNIHTADFGPGEIRGNVVVPEPATLGLVGFALAGATLRRRRI